MNESQYAIHPRTLGHDRLARLALRVSLCILSSSFLRFSGSSGKPKDTDLRGFGRCCCCCLREEGSEG